MSFGLADTDYFLERLDRVSQVFDEMGGDDKVERVIGPWERAMVDIADFEYGAGRGGCVFEVAAVMSEIRSGALELPSGAANIEDSRT